LKENFFFQKIKKENFVLPLGAAALGHMMMVITPINCVNLPGKNLASFYKLNNYFCFIEQHSFYILIFLVLASSYQQNNFFFLYNDVAFTLLVFKVKIYSVL
jgi:hypothetical protein